MKRLICIVFVLAMLLSLCGCDDNSYRIQAANAPFLDLEAYTKLYETDAQQAKKDYEGNLYRYTGVPVFMIYKENALYLGFEVYDPETDMYKSIYQLKVCMEMEEFINIQPGYTYIFAGKLYQDGTIPELRNAILLEQVSEETE